MVTDLTNRLIAKGYITSVATISAGSFKKFEIPKTNELVEVSTPEQLAKDFSDLLNYEKQKSIIKVQNKIYGEVLGKPITQIQLENIGVDVKLRKNKM